MSADLLETLPLAQRLALAYAPRRKRDGVLGLLALNARLAGIVRQQGEPVIAQMKLAWWRERFVQDREDWPVGEPLLALLNRWGGDTRALGHLVDGWEGLLAETLGVEEISQFARGQSLAWAALLDRTESEEQQARVHHAAEQWALADLALNLSDPLERDLALEQLRRAGRDPHPISRAVRPLAVLRGLTLRALDRGQADLLDGPGAMAAALRLGIAGR